MKLVFIVGGLEPGADGVGDYCRLLATACRGRQHSTLLIALNDFHVSPNKIPTVTDHELRLPAEWTWNRRIESALHTVQNFSPDWISIQVVGYAYNPKGFLGSLIEGFRDLSSGTPVHLMFHELWIGFWANASVKQRIIGWRQKRQLLRFVNTLRPRSIHTSIPTYQTMLSDIGVTANSLPIFSNIPIAGAENDWMNQKLESLGITSENRKDWVLLGVMGTVHAEWPAPDWLQYLVSHAQEAKMKIGILAIGRIPPQGIKRLTDSIAAIEPRPHFHYFGAQSVENISAFFKALDAGISTVEQTMLGKSGAVAAMRKHGLPVIVPRLDGASDPIQASRALEGSLRDLLNGTLQPEAPHDAQDVADQFLESLAGV